MLQHVVKVEEFNLVFRGVNLLVAVLEIALNHKCGRISSLAGRRMVRASIPTLGLDIGDLEVLS